MDFGGCFVSETGEDVKVGVYGGASVLDAGGVGSTSSSNDLSYTVLREPFC
jgi:hypothetical protein